MATSEADIAAQLIERLLGDPQFRAEFRRDPASACRKAGLDELADEMSIGAGKAMMTLDQRESKSSLAGVMMAAAMEGVGIYQFGEHVLPHIDDVPSAVGDVLSRVSLPAIPLKGALAGGPDAPAAAPPAEPGTNGAGDAAAGGGGAAGAAPAEAPPETAPPEEAAAEAKAEAKADAKGAAAEKTVPPEQAAADKAAAKIAAAESPEAKRADAVEEAVAKIKEESKDLPDASDVPDGPVQPQPVEEVGKGAGEPDGHDHEHDHGAESPAAAPVATPEAAAAQPAAPAAVEAAAGSGGGGDAAEALLQNKNLVLDADAQKDIRDGAVDPRMIGLLGKLAEKHKIELSVIKTGHAQFTSGGSVSNHFEGRGIDIARVDGEIVNSGSPAARELASEIAEMTGDLRPTEVGTPWAIGASGFFTDAGHQDHLHVAYDGEPPAGFKAPAPSAAPAAGAAAAAAPGAPVAAAAAAPGQPAAAAALAQPKAKPGDSLSFKAVTAEDAAKAAGKKDDELSFMQPPAGPPNAVAAGAVPAVVADAATATAGGSSGLGAAALETAKAELAKGVKEEGVNTGTDVDKYLKEAGVAPGNPWCASFVTWALAQNGHKMEGGGWAAVQTWVQSAEAGKNNLEVVSAEDARPGDIVCYDWGHGEDFAADGHIGFVASDVKGGKFTALEGNNQDRVMTVPRDTSQANVKFLRIKGDAPAGAAAPSAPLAPPPAGAVAPPAAVESGGGSSTPAPPAAVETPGGGADVAAAAVDAGGANPYPGDDAGKEQLAAWMSKEAEKRGLPPQLPVMASLVESGLTNIQGGDADSVGFFQMRVGIWNQGEYAGYPKKPELQVKWFLDQAEQVKKQRVAAGEPIDDPNSFGEWIADVERPAEQYRGRYQLKLGEANDLLGSAATAPPAAAAAAPAPAAPAAAAAVAQPKAKPGDSLSFKAVTAEDAAKAAAQEGRRAVLHEAAGGPRQRDRARRRHARRRGRRGHGDGGRLERPRRLGPGGGEEGARRRREGGGHQHRREGRRVPGRRRRRPGQPVVRELRDVVAGEGRPQDGRGRLGGGADVGPRRRGEDQRPRARRRRGRAPRRHRRLRLGRAGGLRRGRPHRLPGQQRRRRQVHGAGGQQPGRGDERPAVDESGQRQVPPHQGRRSGRGGGPVRAARAPARRRGGSAGGGRVGWRLQHARPARGRRDARRRRRRRGRGGRRGRREPLPGRRRGQGAARGLDVQGGREARPAAPAAGDGLAGRVGPDQHPRRRRRLGRLLPDARRDLEPGRVRRLPQEARAAGQVVPRPGRAGQEAARRRRRADRRPQLLRRVDRRRRTPRRAVPRPLPAQARRSQRPARQRRHRTPRRRGRRTRARRPRGRRPMPPTPPRRTAGTRCSSWPPRPRPRRRRRTSIARPCSS